MARATRLYAVWDGKVLRRVFTVKWRAQEFYADLFDAPREDEGRSFRITSHPDGEYGEFCKYKEIQGE